MSSRSSGSEGAAALSSSPSAAAYPVTRSRLGLVELVKGGDWFVALCSIWLVYFYVQNGSPNIIGIDGYFHIRAAWLIRHEGLHLDFPWLPLTVLNPVDFNDHHLLYHLLLVPFTFFPDLRIGAKFAGVVYAVVATFAVYLLLVRFKVRFPLFWLVVLIAAAEWFLARQSMTRRQSPSLALLMLALYLLANRRYRWLLPLSFAYAWLFDGFVLLVAIVGLAFLARLVAERTWAWPMAFWSGIGIVLALLLNPYFPHNITFTYLHVLPKIMPMADIRVGNEWYPYAPDVLIRTSWLAFALVPLGLLPALLAPRRVLRDPIALMLGSLALLFLVLYVKSRRFIELEPVFAILACAYFWTYYTPRAWRTLFGRLPRLAKGLLVVVLLVGLGAQTWRTVRVANKDTNDNHDFTTYESASDFLKRNTAAGERVYQTDWDDFPELFYYNTHNTYIVGLDPTYMYLENPQLYLLWRSIGRGEVALPSRLILQQFQSRWVITDRAHPGFISRASADPNMTIVFQAPNAFVYHIQG